MIGTIEHRRGKWRARAPRSLGRAGATCATRAEAVAFLLALEQEVAAPRRADGTLAAWGDVVLTRRQGAGLASSDSDAGRWAHVLREDLADMALTAIKPHHVVAFSRALAAHQATHPTPGGQRAPTGKPISRQLQVHCLNLLRVVLAEAVADGKIQANPARDVRPPRAPEGQDIERWTWLRQPEIDQLAALPAPARALFKTAIYTGLRQGELWALRWESVTLDGDRPALLVSRSGKRKTTKSGKPRAVPLLPAALEALRYLHERAGSPTAGWVFPSDSGGQRATGDDGGWADRRQGAYVARGHKTRAGITRAVRFHDLRHTCASHLLQGTWGRRWRLEEVRDFLGHSSITVTQHQAGEAQAAQPSGKAG